MYVLTAAVNEQPTAGGVTTLLFGLVFLAYGLPFATNFRGCADSWAEARTWRSINPRSFIRLHSTIFAIIGTSLVILGLARLIAGNP